MILGPVTWPRRRRCPICGAPNYACGGPTTDHIIPVDRRVKEHRMPDREKLQEVNVTMPGSGLKTTFRTRHPERYRRMERAGKQAEAKERTPARDRARQPAARSGDVETK